ncbi:hypothetical protein ACFFRR_007414 [Megaselia abdita]
MDLKLMILEKLFSAFSGIVAELVKSYDLGDDTKSILNSSMDSISSIITSINNLGDVNTARVNDRRQIKGSRKRNYTDEIEEISQPKVLRTGKQVPSLGVSSRAVKEQSNVVPKPLQATAPVVATADVPVTNAGFKLRAIAPEKKIFLSNFPSDTTTVEIQNHIKEKIPEISSSLINITKIETKSERPSWLVGWFINGLGPR